MVSESDIISILVENEEYFDVLERAIEIEQNVELKPWKNGWNYSDIEAEPHIPRMMTEKGLLDVSRTSNNPNTYEVSNIEQAEEAIRLIKEGSVGKTPDERVDSNKEPADGEIPDDMFDTIIGHEPVKDLLDRCMRRDKQTHFRLQGDSSTAKSLFLTELERLPNSKYRSAGGMTEVGLLDILMEQQPKYLLFDEIDKADNSCYTPLYELTEHGRVQKTISGKDVTIQLDCNLIVTLNHPDRLPRELKSRMIRLDFEEYDDDEYIEVVTSVLQDKFDLDEKVATFIAEYQLEELGVKNVREPEQIAKLADNDIDDVKSVIENIEQYRV
jgi:Zn-finger protein